MFADPKKVDGRRLRRRLKASAAVALAVVAGAFLACKGESNQAEPASPTGPDARSGPGPRPAESAAQAATTTVIANAAPDAGIDAESDAGADAADDAPNDALTVADAAADASKGLVVRPATPKTHQVDKREHRKGMPVRDNLLE